MLKDLRKYCNASQVEMIDRMLNILQMGKFYEKYKELENSPEFANMMSMFKAMSAAENTGFTPTASNDTQSMTFPENLSLPPNFNNSMQNASRILDMLMHQTNNPN